MNVCRGTVSLIDMPDANSECSAGEVSVNFTDVASCLRVARGSSEGASRTEGGLGLSVGGRAGPRHAFGARGLRWFSGRPW